MDGRSPVPPVVCRAIPAGMKLVGYCKDCRWWDPMRCPIVITTLEADDEHITPPDFGCVHWKPIEEEASDA